MTPWASSSKSARRDQAATERKNRPKQFFVVGRHFGAGLIEESENPESWAFHGGGSPGFWTINDRRGAFLCASGIPEKEGAVHAKRS